MAFIPEKILKKRFWDKVSGPKGSGCWLWMGSKRNRGYGELHTGERTEPAHRLSYQWFVGPILEGMTIDHICRVTSCVNPDHLRMMRMVDNCRLGNRFTARTACHKGHEFTQENTYLFRGYRCCRTCKRAKDHLFHSRHRERILARKRQAWLASCGKAAGK